MQENVTKCSAGKYTTIGEDTALISKQLRATQHNTTQFMHLTFNNFNNITIYQ